MNNTPTLVHSVKTYSMNHSGNGYDIDFYSTLESGYPKSPETGDISYYALVKQILLTAPSPLSKNVTRKVIKTWKLSLTPDHQLYSPLQREILGRGHGHEPDLKCEFINYLKTEPKNQWTLIRHGDVE